MPTIKQAKALTITFLTPVSLGSLNGSDKEADNLSSIKKLTQGNEDVPLRVEPGVDEPCGTNSASWDTVCPKVRPPRRRRARPSRSACRPISRRRPVRLHGCLERGHAQAAPVPSGSRRCWHSTPTRATSISGPTTWASMPVGRPNLRDRDPRRAVSRERAHRAGCGGQLAVGEGVSAAKISEAWDVAPARSTDE